jgi:hypothetical protein
MVMSIHEFPGGIAGWLVNQYSVMLSRMHLA